MSADERPLTDVPRWLWAALALALAGQVATHALRAPVALGGADLPPAPSIAALRLASFGEQPAAARLTMIYVQAYDLGGANELPYRKLDYERLRGWLEAALALDPRSDYPLFLAARVYAEVKDPARMRLMLDFVHREFLRDPDRRWQWLAHAAILAKHQLNDLPLARTYAAAIERNVRAADIPIWARQMEVFILEDMNELEAAKIMLGGLLANGQITDPTEIRTMRRRLEEMEARLAGQKVK